MSAREFAEWVAFDRYNPIGDERQDYMLAQIPYVVTSLLSSKKQDRPKFSDFLPKWGPNRRKDPKELEARFRLLAQRSAKKSGASPNRKIP